MWIQLHAIPVPHGKLELGIPTVRPPRCRRPGPNLVRVHQIQLSFESARRKQLKFADEIAIDVIGVVFVLRK
jgi:hypothetical protein